jgi:Ala-tRNA(Pro) deacylase
MLDIYQVLQDLEIEYEKHEHLPVFTCEEAEKHIPHLPGGKDKNLFLRNKKGNKHYLVSVESHKRVDLKNLAKILEENNLGFASPKRLKKHLNLTPGSVTPFGLINDKNKEVEVIIDEDLMAHDRIQFHPNTNTATIIVKSKDFKKFLEWTGNKVRYVKL